MDCTKCGRDVSETDSFCPKCGSPIVTIAVSTEGIPPALTPDADEKPDTDSKAVKKGQPFSWRDIFNWQIISILVFCVGFVYILNRSETSSVGSKENDPTSAAKAEQSALNEQIAKAEKTSVESLDHFYKSNEVAADDLYKGKPILVSGALARISRDYRGEVVLYFSTRDKFRYDYVSAAAYLKSNQTDKAVSLSPRQSVSLLCVGGGMILGSPQLDDCVLVQVVEANYGRQKPIREDGTVE